MVLKAVFFDLDDTLAPTSDCDALAFATVCAHASTRTNGALDQQKLISDFKATLKLSPWDPGNRTTVSKWRAGLWRAALDAQGVTDAEVLGNELQGVFNNCRLANFHFVPELPDLLVELARKNIKAVIITNGHPSVQREKLAACKANTWFPDPEQIIIGGEEILIGRWEKPAAEIFFKACHYAGCSPGEAIHVGDDLLTDIQVSDESGGFKTNIRPSNLN